MNEQQTYNSIFLFGPRLAGKSTLGKILAEKLNITLIDTDHVIFERAGQTVDKITNNGSNWQTFRQMELDLLVELLEKDHIIASCAGGIGVNNIVKTGTEKTFGEVEAELLKNKKNALKVVLLPNREAFKQRVKEDETVASATHRPVLDEKRAAELQTELNKLTDEKEKSEFIINEKIKSTLDSYDQRESLYRNLGSLLIDTGEKNIDESVNEIIKAFNSQ